MQRSVLDSCFDIDHHAKSSLETQTRNPSSFDESRKNTGSEPLLSNRRTIPDSQHHRRLRGMVWGIAALILTVAGLQVTGAADDDNVLLDFTATWCGPCQQMSPIISKLERAGLPIRKVDIDQEPELAERFNVKTIPCFVLVANGKEIERVGKTTEKQLRSMLSRISKPVDEIASAGVNGRRGIVNGSGNGFLGAPISIGSLETLNRLKPKAPYSGLFGGKSREQKQKSEQEDLDDSTIARAQSPLDPSHPESNPVDPLRASVRLRVQDDAGIFYGSGTIIDSRPGQAVILTCGHIFRKAGSDSKIEVDLFQNGGPSKPETLVGKVMHFDLEIDVGLLLIAYPQRLPIAKIGPATVQPAVNDPAFSIGCGGGDVPTRQNLVLTALNKYAGPANIECTEMPQQGRSGGGLFVGQELIGVCIAADPKEKRGIYVGTKPITQLLDKVGLGQVVPVTATPDRALASGTPEEGKAVDFENNPLSDRGSRNDIVAIGRLLGGDLGTATLSEFPASVQDYEGAEIICIVRPKTPGTSSRVVIVNQASQRFVGDLLHESQTTAERSMAERQQSSPKKIRERSELTQASQRLFAPSQIQPMPTPLSASTLDRPIETSFTPQLEQRQRNR